MCDSPCIFDIGSSITEIIKDGDQVEVIAYDDPYIKIK